VLRKIALCIVFLLGAFCLSLAAQSAPQKEKSPAPATSNSASSASGAAAAKPGSVEDRVEKYLRNLYAWGPNYTLKVGPTKPSPIPDLLEVPVTVSMGGQSDTAAVYVSKTGNFLVRGELTDMSVDPFAETRSKLHVGNSPTLGPEDAKVTLFEFADFECPSCRQLDRVLREYLPHHPEVRLVFKHYPLTEIHPWAMTAAIATQCAYQQSPAAFWKMHDAIFDAQDVISPSNVWDKLQELATQEGLDPNSYRACVINPATTDQVRATIEEGHAVSITATPTTFINGRRQVGPDQASIEQTIQYSQPVQ
jgi:protein-disulfide isomerase